VSHCFPLAPPTDAEPEGRYSFTGLPQLSQAYRDAAKAVTYKGPTVYSDVIYKYDPAVSTR